MVLWASPVSRSGAPGRVWAGTGWAQPILPPPKATRVVELEAEKEGGKGNNQGNKRVTNPLAEFREMPSPIGVPIYDTNEYVHMSQAGKAVSRSEIGAFNDSVEDTPRLRQRPPTGERRYDRRCPPPPLSGANLMCSSCNSAIATCL